MSETKLKPRHWSFEEKCLVVKYALEHREQSVEEVAKAVGVKRSALYRWLKRVGWDVANLERLRPAGCGRHRTLDGEGLSEGVQEEIRSLLDAYPNWGPLKIKHYFWRHRQMVISQRRIYEFLKAEGVIEARRRRGKEVEDEGRGKRRFEAPEPLSLVQMDCLRLELTGGQAIWLVTLLDDYSRFILHSRFVAVKTMEAVMEVFSEGVKAWGVMERVLTDQGTEFVSWQGFTRFEELLLKLDVELIVAASEHPETVGKLERFHETFREHLREHGPVDYGSQAQLVIREFVPWYNYERPHEALGGLTPADRFFGVSEPLEAELNAYAQGRRVGSQLYLCCRIGNRRIVLSGPRANAVEMYANGRRLNWAEEGAGGLDAGWTPAVSSAEVSAERGDSARGMPAQEQEKKEEDVEKEKQGHDEVGAEGTVPNTD